MKKVIFGTALASMALLSACSSDNELANVGTSSNNAIGFHVVGNKAETRATPITSSNLNTTDFNVYAFTKDGKAFMGQSDEENAFAWNGINIVNKAGVWDYAKTSDLRYWPEITTPLDFYAVNPSTVGENDRMNLSWNMTSSSQKIFYTTADEHGNDRGHTNYDVMYAIAKDQTKETKSGKVALTFKHILSQIAFKAKTKEANMKVEIKGMKIHNIQTGGTFKFPDDANTAATREANWAPNGINALTYTIGVKNKTTVTDALTEIFTEPILFVPQKLTPWATTASAPITKEAADAAKQSYLEVNCKIWKDGHLIFGTETEVENLTDNEGYKTLYVPFGTSWEPGKRHIYTLIFGGGYDNQGNPFLTPINFEPTVEDWNDVTSGNDINIDK